jgi:ribosomal RNA assembly protein
MPAIFEKHIKIPLERVGVLIGKGGEVKRRIEEACRVKLEVESETGNVAIKLADDPQNSIPFKAAEIVMAIGRGHSPERAFKLLDEGWELRLVDLMEYARSREDLVRVRARLIGSQGKARRTIEELTDTYISIYGDTACILGEQEHAAIAEEAVRMLASGSPHASVYSFLQKRRKRLKFEELALWEGKVLGEG